jgi:hypothetical protein
MLRTVLCCAAMALVVHSCRADEPAANPETLIRLTVRPAAAPKPALRHQLLPELKEMSPGNPIQNYLKCFAEQQKFFFDKEAVQRREKLLVMPLKELPARELLNFGGFALRQADWGARLDNPDWQMLLNLKAEGIFLLIPDVQELRPLADALKVRMRAEVALGRFDDALRTAKTIFALARHLGEHPTFVGNVKGFAAATMAVGPLEEMLEQPGCPNLYWALTHLPDPLVPVDRGAEGERIGIVQWMFHDLDDNAPMSTERLERFISFMDKLLRTEFPNKLPEGLRAWLDARTKDDALVRAARHRLVENGLPEAEVRRFPAGQVFLLDEKRELEVRFDDAIKTIHLPVWQAEAVSHRSSATHQPVLFADSFVPAVDKVLKLRGRLDQRIRLLRCVEALRLTAAEHEGKLPANLSEVTVPLPDDPFTGKPFRYEVAGHTAHLRGTAPPGLENDPTYHIHYELTLRK